MQNSIFSDMRIILILTLLFTFQKAEAQELKEFKAMVVTAESLATQAGVEILKKGGNAVDAAVATGFALAVTYPVAGNIGGGGFMVIHLADSTDITIDYREKAPLKAYRDMYLDKKGDFIPELAQEGILAAGVPGAVAGMLYALEKYGTMTVKEILEPAVRLAEDGFKLPFSTAQSFNNYNQVFSKYPSTKKIFTKPGGAFREGELFVQKDLAATLRRIQEKGAAGFYSGETVDLIVKQNKELGGLMTAEDFAQYKAVERKPVKGTYKDFEVISMGPPSSGGIAVIEMLNMIENFDLSKIKHNSSAYLHLLAEVMKRAYADRAEHLGDPDFYKVPVSRLLSKKYAETLAFSVRDTATPSALVLPGNFDDKESEQTTHYSVLDEKGNAVSVTTTINSGYGCKVVAEGLGFFWNNEMDDFSAKPGVPNQFGLIGNLANAIEPGKRMLSSMTPTIILKNGKPYLIVGSPGGATIITAVLQVILNVLDFNMNVKEALSALRMHHQWKPDEIQHEKGITTEDDWKDLEVRKHKRGRVRVLGLIEAILVNPATGLATGASDPRGSGLASGY
ncbi:MAG: gamma-glutamyltransferase [Ignavibacteriaceae bacterium]|nr:gamma-glutamyltransferase [Ignavibacteriaceae bacterium]